MAVPRNLTNPIPSRQSRVMPWRITIANRGPLAWACLVVCVVLGVAAITLTALAASRGGVPAAQLYLGTWTVFFLTYPLVGALIASHHPQNRIAWILCVIGLVWQWCNATYAYGVYGITARPESLPGARVVAWSGFFYPVGLWLILAYLLLVFPTGQALTPRWRVLGWLGALGAAGASLWLAFGTPLLFQGEFGQTPNPFARGGTVGNMLDYVGLGFFVIFACGIAAAVSMILRLRRSSGIEHLQLKWIAYDAAWVGFFFCIHFTAEVGDFYERFPWIAIFWGLSLASLPVAIGIAILRYRLFDIDLLINRTLVYLALTACVVALYVGLVGGLGAAIQVSRHRVEGNLVASLLVTGLVAVLFQPLRSRLQRGVNRLLYGDRDEPYAVLSRLGARLEATLAPDAVLPAIVHTVAEALKLPYAAIVLPGGGQAVAAAGQPVPDPVRLPLVYQHEHVGELRVAPRQPGDAFSPADRALLEGLARQAGVAAHAVRLTADLQRAREHLVAAREEERRRLRRDLHDGLGAQLAGLTVQASALRRLIPRDPDAAVAEVTVLQTELRGAIADIRRLVHDLRPPALDELGLLGALRARLARHSTAGALAGDAHELSVTLDAPPTLPSLPAAVEVAAYRIVEEALTNVVRHASARRCVVRLEVNGDLRITVEDDGIGMDPAQPSGVGLLSMRERAAELGGRCDISPGPTGGTRISVSLPVES